MPLASIPSPPRTGWHLGPLPLRAQALCVVAGILLAIWVADRRYRKAGGPRGVLTEVAAWAIPAGLIPAGIGALVAQAHGGGWQPVRTWDAVLGYPGAVALGTLGAWLACRRPRAGRAAPSPPPAPSSSAAPSSAATLPSPLPAPSRPSATPARSRSSATPAPAPAPDGALPDGALPDGALAGGALAAGGGSRSVVALATAITPATVTMLVKGGHRLRFRPLAAAAAPAIALGQAVGSLGSWFSQQGYGHPSSLPWAVAIAPAHRPAGYENFATFQPIFLYQALWGVATALAVTVAVRRLALRGDRALALYAAAYAAGGFALFWLGIGHLPVVFGLRAGELGDAAVLLGAVAYLVHTRPKRPKTYQPAQKPALESDSPVM